MKLADCEISHRHVRGHNAVVLCGERSLADAEREALLHEYLANYGAANPPAYFSPAGWQMLEVVPSIEEPERPKKPLKNPAPSR